MDIDSDIDFVSGLSFADIERKLPIQLSQPQTQDPLDSARYLFRTLMTFLKSICYGFKNCNRTDHICGRA
ncbi:hypothetical protein JL09_g6860 [Pichia kudriavzevii]|uniref:Uncharacterized protein n=1 Tax=Pichia kudriavzevii TaxID=4909 RepID=A0A099NK87_PICKU|nr:hypothetical protein JL09_g6869 [Pichia kudriavzevii]KGK32533.1 hypothetical protein JL09_g6860 [Pichia kudriavzevii]